MPFHSRTAWAVAVLLLLAGTARAASPQTYRLDLQGTGVGAMDAALKNTSELEQLRTTAPVGPNGLIARAEGDADRLTTVLESFGYYQSKTTIKINGLGINDANLDDALRALPKGTDARVDIAFELGPIYHVGRITIDGQLPQGMTLPLQSGAPALATDVLAAGTQLQTSLQNAGYAFATVDEPVAYEDPAARVLNLTFHVVAGQKVRLGEIRITGLTHVREQSTRERLKLTPGQAYSARRIERARQNLLDQGLFSSVSVQLGEVDAQGQVPVIFQVRERKRHAVSFTAAYSSDLGGSGGVTWSNRDLFGRGEQLSLSATVLDIDARSSDAMGYDTKGVFIRPDFYRTDQSLQLSLEALRQSLQSSDQTAAISAIQLSRRLSRRWNVSAGFSTAHEHVVEDPGGVAKPFNYTLLMLPLGVIYNSTGVASPLQDSLHGLRATLIVTPTESLGTPNATFVVGQLSASTFFDLTPGDGVGRSVLALRGLLGRVMGAGLAPSQCKDSGLPGQILCAASVPPDQRFYGGGSATLRGYQYQSVGPLYDDGNPEGGTAIEAGTIEFRQRFGRNFGAAVFADAAQVGVGAQPFTGQWWVGVGTGIRYYTPIGAIRLDVAVPTRRRSSDQAFQLYVGLGQAF